MLHMFVCDFCFSFVVVSIFVGCFMNRQLFAIHEIALPNGAPRPNGHSTKECILQNGFMRWLQRLRHLLRYHLHLHFVFRWQRNHHRWRRRSLFLFQNFHLFLCPPRFSFHQPVGGNQQFRKKEIQIILMQLKLGHDEKSRFFFIGFI